MRKGISRRDFLKGMAASAVGVAAVGMLPACSGSKSKGAYTPGTYTSTQKTGFATVVITCVFSSSALTDASYKVTESSGSDYFPKVADAAADYCKRVVAAGTADGVDGISGASLCSKAIKDGINDCIAQAKGIKAAAASTTASAGLNPQNFDYTGNSISDFTKTALFSEWKLGPLTLHHRMVKSAAFQLAFLNNNPKEYISYYENFAKGGVEMIWVENFANLMPMTATPMKKDFSAYDVKGLLKAIHDAGAYAGYQFDTMGSPIGPLVYTGSFIDKITTEEVKKIQKGIIGAAKTLHDAGFDAFELNSAANNVGQSFLSRARNNRTDEYGAQSMENRTRFASEIIQGIKKACGKDFVVQVLINGIEENDQNLGDNSLYNSVEEVKEIAKRLEAAGADSLHVRLGPCGQHIAQFASDLYFSPRGIEGATGFGGQFDFSRHFQGKAIGSHSGCGMMLDIAAEIKSAVSIPVGTVTYMDPAHAPDFFESALKDGKVDFLIMNRPLCVDPEYVNKLREGRIDEIAPCTRCMHCFFDPDKEGKLMEHCRVNTTTHRAFNEQMPEGYDPLPANGKKNVMVVGAGPAGLEAARIAAQRGYTVTLYEKSSAVGGLLSFANAVKGPHENLEALRKYLERQQEVRGVKVVTGKEVDAAFIKEQNPNVVILAVGGKRDKLGLSGTKGTAIVSVDDVLGANIGDNVTVVGSNCQAVDTALYLMSLGKKVTIVTPDPIKDFEKGHSANVKGFIETAIFARGTRVWPSASVTAVGNGEITIHSEADVDVVIKCDTIIEAMDMLPNTGILDGISGIEAYAVGDCKDPWNIAEAITAGNLTARKI